MKKRLVTYLLVSALAAAVFAGCSKKDAGDAADAAATAEAAVEEAADAAEAETEAEAEASVEDVAAAADAADAAEAAAVAGTSDGAEADMVAAEDDDSVAEFIDDEENVEEATEETPAEGEYLIVEPGTTYTIRFGGYIYSTPEEIPENIIYVAQVGDYVNIVERLDNFWYKVSYYIAYDPTEYVGYLQIQ